MRVILLMIMVTFLFSNDYINPFTGKRDDFHPEYPLRSDQYLDDIYDYDLLHYEYFIDVTDTLNQAVSGYARFDLKATALLDTFIFDLKDELVVDSIVIENQVVDSSLITRVDDRTYVALVSPLPIGEEDSYTIYYHGVPPAGSYFNASYDVAYHSGSVVISTMSSPQAARYWHPCKDIPKDKATLDIYIKCMEYQTAVSNGLKISEEVVEDSKKVVHYHESYPVCTYITSIAVSNYENISSTWVSPQTGEELPLEYYVYPEHKEKAIEDFRNIGLMMDCFSERYGEYPFMDEKYGMAIFPWSGGMENQTITSFGSGLINGTLSNESIVAHELAHHWFGDRVNIKTWNDVWLKEGGAVLSEAVWAEYQDGALAYRDFMNSLKSSVVAVDQPIFGYQPTFSRYVYNKGAWIFSMVKYLLGDDIFYDGVKDYVYGSNFHVDGVSTEDFFDFFGQYTDRDLIKFKEQWVYKGGVPRYRFSYKIENGEENSLLKVRVRQVQDTSGEIPIFDMPIPLMVQFSDFTDSLLVLENSLENQTYSFSFDKNIHNNIPIDNFNYMSKVLALSEAEQFEDFEYSDTNEQEIKLLPNVPNPFNSKTTINFYLASRGGVNISLYNVKGESIFSRSSSYRGGGIKSMELDLTDFSSGIYYLMVGDYSGNNDIKKITYIK